MPSLPVRIPFAAFVVTLITGISAPVPALAQPALGSPGQAFATAAASGAWTFFTDPRAVYYKGAQEKTYCGFIDRPGSTRIWSLDHRTARVDTFTLHARLQVDDHDNPALYVRKDGRLTAYYQKHGNDRFVLHRTTVRAEDITAWGPEDTLLMPDEVTYAHVFRLKAEADRLHVLNRTIDWHPTLTTSNNEGDTWSTPVKVVGGTGARPYIKHVSDGNARIHMAFTDGHPRDEAANSIYYAYYENGAYFRAGGTRIKAMSALPLAPKTDPDLIYDGATAGRAWIWDIALDSLGRPAMVYSVCPTESDHRYHYARWNGTAWTKGEMTRAGKWFPQTPAGTTEREPHYSGGIILDHEDPSVVYLSKPSPAGIFEIEQWTTPDGGRNWASRMVTSGSAKHNARPTLAWAVPGQRRERKLLFWMHGDYVHYTNYSTGIRYHVFETPTSARPGSGWEAAGRPGLSFRALPGALEVTHPPLPGRLSLADPAGREVAAAGVSGSGPARGGHVASLAVGGLAPGLYLLSFAGEAGAARARPLPVPIGLSP